MKDMRFLSFILLTLVCLSAFTNFAIAETQSITVSARNEDSLRFYLNDGDKMKYTVSVDGGSNDDIVLDVKNPYGGSIGQKGRIVESYSDTIYADTDGYYIFEFDNSMSLISKKQVVLNYDIIKKPVVLNTFGSNTNSASSNYSFSYMLILIPIIIIVVIIIVVIRKSKKSYKEGKEEVIHKYKDSKINESKSIKKSLDVKKNSELIRILKERLAKGEITKEEYDELKKEFED